MTKTHTHKSDRNSQGFIQFNLSIKTAGGKLTRLQPLLYCAVHVYVILTTRQNLLLQIGTPEKDHPVGFVHLAILR